MNAAVLVALVVLGGYLVGSIPFGWLLTRAAGLGDIRAVGSGNIGATNVLRTGRKDIAALTLLLDGGKGAVAVLVAALAGPGWGLLAGVAAVAGHCTSVWMGGKGGKGVATGIGVILAVAWPVGVATCVIWLAVARLTRMSSAGALVAFAVAPFLMWLWAGTLPALAIAAVGTIVYWRHRDNIGRLMAGTEPRIGR